MNLIKEKINSCSYYVFLYIGIVSCLFAMYFLNNQLLKLLTMNRPEGIMPIFLLVIFSFINLLVDISLVSIIYLLSKRLFLDLRKVK